MLRLLTLGGLAMTRDGDPCPALSLHGLALLTRIAASGVRGISRQKLAGSFWPERDERHARHCLSQALYELRRALDVESIVVGREILRLDDASVSGDLMELEAALESRDWERVSALYTGPFLDGIYVPGADEFDRWSDAARTRLADAVLRGFREAAAAAAARGDRSATGWLERAWDLDPLHLPTTLSLVRALAESGDPATARRRAHQHALLVREELHSEPQECLSEFIASLQPSPASSTPADEPGSACNGASGSARSGLTAAELCARARQCLHTFTAARYAEGISLAERAVALDPAHAESHVTLGSLYIVSSQATPLEDRRGRGVAKCRRAAALNPDLAEAWLWQGWASMLDGRYTDAEVLARRGATRDPQSPFSHHILGWIALAEGLGAGRWDRCVQSAAAFLRVLALHPREQHALMPLVSLYALVGRYDSAGTFCDQAVEVERSTASEMRMAGAVTLRGLLHLRRGRLEEAAEVLGGALREYASAPQLFGPYVRALTLCGLGDCERQAGRYDRAVSHYMEARLQLEPVPQLMGCGYLATRVELRLAAAFRRLRMRQEERRHAAAAKAITRVEWSFNWCWEVSKAQLNCDRAIYEAACGDRARALRSLRTAMRYGWREPAALLTEPEFECYRDDPDFVYLVHEEPNRPALPDIGGGMVDGRTGAYVPAILATSRPFARGDQAGS